MSGRTPLGSRETYQIQVIVTAKLKELTNQGAYELEPTADDQICLSR